MAILKLFISHSSRLDDVNGAQDTEENWKLLKQVCDEIKSRNLELEIDILVDQSIGSGKDWEKQLNLWLAECHAAIILYSKRALEQSDWVKKEATILTWRWQVDNSFPLLPVFFDKETRIEDAKKEFSAATGIDQINSVNCTKSAVNIVDELLKQDSFKALKNRIQSQSITTPFTRLAEDLKLQLEAPPSIRDDLVDAWKKLNHPEKSAQTADSVEEVVHHLIRFLLVSPRGSIEKLHLFSNQIIRPQVRQRIQGVYSTVRGFWVDAGSAGWLPTRSRKGTILALNGNRLNKPASTGTGTTHNFTVDRYINKAWINETGLFVTVTDETCRDDIERLIWEEYGHYLDELDDLPCDELNETIRIFRDEVNKQTAFIVVYFPLTHPATGIPDPSRIEELKGLSGLYPRLRVIIGTGQDILTEEIPGIRQIDPVLDTDLEKTQYLKDGPLYRRLCQ